MSQASRFDLVRFEAERAARSLTLGRPVQWLADTVSTNDDALAAARQGAEHGALFGAETQLRGRGRRGSEWLSTPSAGLWFSLLLRPRLRPELAPGLALCAGLAVRETAASRVSASVLVKWPNDVLATGRKLAGVLVESQISGARLESVIVGIGINLEQLEFPEAISGVATSLALLGATQRERERLLAELLSALELRLQRFEADGFPGIVEELRRHDALLNEHLRVDGQQGIGAGIDEQGRLLLRRDDGSLEPQLSGHVELLA